MPRVCPAALALAIALAGAAQAQSQPPAAPPLELSTGTGCNEPIDGEVIVCRERGRSPYRIDPATLDAIRREEAIRNPDRVASREPPPEKCGVGPNICAGGTFPISQPVLKVVGAIVNAIQGEDWREPFRTGPDEYELYRESKRQADAGPD